MKKILIFLVGIFMLINTSGCGPLMIAGQVGAVGKNIRVKKPQKKMLKEAVKEVEVHENNYFPGTVNE